MGKDITDLEQMMRTLASASTDPASVTVGDFAKAVQSLHAELQMLEAEVAKLGGTVAKGFGRGEPVAESATRATVGASPAAQPAATDA